MINITTDDNLSLWEISKLHSIISNMKSSPHISLAPVHYDFGDSSNYSFVENVTCANDDARKMFVEAFGHMLNYNHEQAIAWFNRQN